MARLRAFLDDFWTDGLDRLREAAEAEQRRRTHDRRHDRSDIHG
jgi:hypothetical protein